MTNDHPMKRPIPRFISIMAVFLGGIDLLRGIMHTVVLPYSATHIACLDLSGPTAPDLLRLLGLFGISNYITGATLILTGLYARPIALVLLGLIPTFYGLGLLTIHAAMNPYPPSTAQWGGRPFMMINLSLYVLTFLAGIFVLRHRKTKPQIQSLLFDEAHPPRVGPVRPNPIPVTAPHRILHSPSRPKTARNFRQTEPPRPWLPRLQLTERKNVQPPPRAQHRPQSPNIFSSLLIRKSVE